MGGPRSITERLSGLPPGRHTLPADFVADHQRARLLQAVSEIAADVGYQKTTIELVAKSARVSLKTFYEHFASKEECFLAAFDNDVEEAAEIFRERLGDLEPWADRIAAGLQLFVELVIAEPRRARLCLVASQSAGSAAFARYQATLERVASIMRGGRSLNPQAGRMPDGLEVAIAGGVAWLVSQRLVKEEDEGLRELLPEITQLALTPYVGEEEARAAADRAAAGDRAVVLVRPDYQAGEI